MKEKKIQEKILAYRILEARLNTLLKNREMLESKIIEAQNATESIKELKKNDNVIFSLGSESFAFAKITERKLIVEVGANIAFEKTVEEALEMLNKKKKGFEDMLNEIENNINEISSTLEQLGIEIQELSKLQK